MGTKYVDIDGTICRTDGMKYTGAEPIEHRIKLINKWYDEGNTIIYWTSRGVSNGRSWRVLTEKQLKNWGCKYHELRLDKPIFDQFYDDHCWNSKELDKCAFV